MAEPEDGEVTHDTYIPDDDEGEEASAQIGEDDGEETSGEADSQDDILEQLSREAEGGTE
ncbi:hypothetical protein BAE30_09670 [Acidithiobacillus caldus]|uniref:Uncharacterized protein n=1 Tax=Acidithiobacillus caldus TaxID=33059 RepID=A0A1E7YUI4_9PROT|nr:hypothetical protein BAE30_09670 [Acidithiobacillus caldus]